VPDQLISAAGFDDVKDENENHVNRQDLAIKQEHFEEDVKTSRLSRKDFRETVGQGFCHDVLSGKFSYDEIIDKYRKIYPEYASKFTPNFCSKVRCGRILNSSQISKKLKSDGVRMKRITKISKRKNWSKMTAELFAKIYEWESGLSAPVKQAEIEHRFNVNRSTYYRWKKKFGLPHAAPASCSKKNSYVTN